MPTVNGRLKYFAPTRDGDRATLTAEPWSDGEKKHYVSWEEAKPLRDAGVVFKGGQTWEDGKPKWEVRGKPMVTLNQRWEKSGDRKECFTTVVLGNGASSDGEAKDTSPQTTKSPYRSVEEVARHFAYCLKQALETVWVNAPLVNADALYKTAYTIYSDADPDDTPDN